jgi:RCC1 and BTB domain-containing protein
VYTVGRNDNGQLGQGHFCHELTPRVNRTLSTREIKVIQTSCGLHHTVFVTKSGQLYSCGFNDNGQLGHSDTKSRNVPCLVTHPSFSEQTVKTAVCGYYHTIVLKTSGEVFSFGRNDKGQLGIKTNGVAQLEPKKITNFYKLSDEEDLFARRGSANASHLYNNKKYYLKDQIKTVKVACGCYHTLLVCDNGHLYTFGRGNHGQLGHGNIDD